MDQAMEASAIRVVLIETSHPGNIGAVARSMKTMGLQRLKLVKPRHFPHAEATTRASGADDLLAQAEVCETLEQALAGATLVMGTSARLRTMRWPQLNPRECAAVAVDACQRGGEVAILFGQEQSGLSNDELARCSHLINIPTNPTFSSLNLASAVQLVSYELLMARGEGSLAATEQPPQGRERPASVDDIEQFYQHLEQTLVTIGFFDPEKPRLLLRRLRRLYNRTALSCNELNILRGILSATEKWHGSGKQGDGK